MKTEVYYSPEGEPSVWVTGQQPEGYLTAAEWMAANPAPALDPADFNPGSAYEKRSGQWWKIRFSKKDFLLLCGLNQVAALNTAINNKNALAKTVHDLLFASDFIDVTDPATIQMVHILASPEAGAILSAEQAAEVLKGQLYEEES